MYYIFYVAKNKMHIYLLFIYYYESSNKFYSVMVSKTKSTTKLMLKNETMAIFRQRIVKHYTF